MLPEKQNNQNFKKTKQEKNDDTNFEIQKQHRVYHPKA